MLCGEHFLWLHTTGLSRKLGSLIYPEFIGLLGFLKHPLTLWKVFISCEYSKPSVGPCPLEQWVCPSYVHSWSGPQLETGISWWVWRCFLECLSPPYRASLRFAEVSSASGCLSNLQWMVVVTTSPLPFSTLQPLYSLTSGDPNIEDLSLTATCFFLVSPCLVWSMPKEVLISVGQAGCSLLAFFI